MSMLTWDLKMHTLSILKRFSFSFLLVFFFFFFCIFDFKSQKNEKCQRVLRSILVLCVVWMFKFAWLHDIIRGKILIFLFKNSCRLIIQSGEVYIYIYIYIYIDIYRVPPWRCIVYFCSRFFWVENIYKPARQSLDNSSWIC